MKTIVTLKSVRESGNRESWFKSITGVIEGATGAKGFVGEYLKPGENRLEVGSLVLHVWPSGSVKHQINKADVLLVNEDGSTTEIMSGKCWRTEYPSIQDFAENALSKTEPINPLAAFTDDEIRAEFIRRGLIL